VRRAADRAARLLAELAGGIVSVGTVEARGDPPATTETVELDPERANRLLGTGIAPEEMADLLARIEVTATSTAQGRLQARIPSYRNDLHRPEDLVEEVARIYGYARIEATLPQAPLAKIQRPPTQVLEEQTRDVLKHSGLIEAMTFVAISADSLARLGLGAEDPRRRTVRILNPILEGESELRTSLLPSLLNAARRNLTRQVERVRLFEVSRVFLAKEREALPEERSSVAVVLAGEEEPGLWSGSARTPLFFQLKGVAEALLRELGYVASFPAEADSPYLHPGAACGISVEGQPVGRTGELHPEVVARFEIGVPCAILELDLSRLVELPRREVRYAEVSRQPQVRRDLAVLVDRGIAAGEVLDAIRGAGGRTLVSVEIFDRYQGKGIPEGKVSLAFRLIFQRPDRTLTDDEVSRMTDRVVQTLSQRFGGVLR
jgi:phenylalanyl-tRNA synthetase beta chain